ncbi:MAG TPA: hypothetical protein VLJ68_08640 [Chitinophagaceae bacterium]|nr:hypothetical protein [Chitinophagaceae bacterium]
MARDNFSSTVKNKLALRAGYLCSICRKMTVGPSKEGPLSISRTGVAAHIYGAAKGHLSRRQDESLSSEYKKSIENGIWLCSSHSILIDRDESTYTATMLFDIKRKHEAYVSILNGGINVQSGILIRLEFSNLPSPGNTIELDLTEKNIIIGSNGVGKTMICEFIKALNDISQIERWKRRIFPGNAFCNLYYFKEDKEKYSILIDAKGNLNYEVNDMSMPVLKPAIHVLYMKDTFYEFWQREDPERENTILEILAKFFSMTSEEFVTTVSIMRKESKLFTSDIFIEDGDLFVRFTGRLGSFESFSGGEKERIMLDIILTVAKYYSKFTSTILLLERGAIGNIDNWGVNMLLDHIRNGNVTFQTILMIMPPATGINLEQFKCYQLEGSRETGITTHMIS